MPPAQPFRPRGHVGDRVAELRPLHRLASARPDFLLYRNTAGRYADFHARLVRMIRVETSEGFTQVEADKLIFELLSALAWAEQAVAVTTFGNWCTAPLNVGKGPIGIIGDGHFDYLPDPPDPKAKLAPGFVSRGLVCHGCSPRDRNSRSIRRRAGRLVPPGTRAGGHFRTSSRWPPCRPRWPHVAFGWEVGGTR